MATALSGLRSMEAAGEGCREEAHNQQLTTTQQPGAMQQHQGHGSSSEAASSSSSDVKVVVRVRPVMLNMELQPGVHTCVEVEGHNVCTVRTPHDTVSMPFNWVAGPATTQAEFFKVVGRPTVENCLSGFNSSIFAYGQTGSGKTHTMIGELPAADGPASLPADAGIIPRIFKYLWQRMPEVQAGMLANLGGGSQPGLVQLQQRRSLHAEDSSSSSCGGQAGAEQPSLKWLVRWSMLEIHKEDIYDLLLPGSGPLNIREDIRRGVYVEGLCERVVEDVSDALDALRAGIVNRQVAATELNAASSRSHVIFTCHIESRLEAQAGMVNVRSSRLHLVDLAGSERLKTQAASAAWASGCQSVTSSWDGGAAGAGSSGIAGGAGGVGGGGGGAGGGNSSSSTRLRETTSINSSLTVLGLVILRLTEQQPHIPYRNSKLTFLLQDSIGGNAKTVIVANISPSEACVQETLSTLGFAARARKIVNKAVVNDDHNDDVTLLRQKIKRLQQELLLARAVAAKASAGLLRLSDTNTNSNSASASAGGACAGIAGTNAITSAGVAVAAAAQQRAADSEAAQQQLALDQQEQLAGALQLLSELGDRNSELEQAVEFCRRERDALEQNCLEARQEVAAMHVSLQQTLSENKKRHRWFKPDKSSKAASAQQQHQQQQQDSASVSPAAAAAAVADRSSPSSSSASKAAGAQQGGSGWSLSSMFGKRDKARSAASKPHQGDQQQQQQDAGPDSQQQDSEHQQHQAHEQQLQHILHLVSTQLSELAGSVGCRSSFQHCSAAAAAGVAAAGGETSSAPSAAAAGSAAAEDWASAAAGKQDGVQAAALLQLQEMQRQHNHQGNTPELQTIVSALRTLVAWQQQQQQEPPGWPSSSSSAAGGGDVSAAAAAAAASSPSKAKTGSSKVAPSELHRQLFEERELTAQLQGRIRQLQQELLLAGGPAVASTLPHPTTTSTTTAVCGSPALGPKFGSTAAARLARLSPGVGVHYSADAAVMRGLAVAPTELDAAFAEVLAAPGQARSVQADADSAAADGAEEGAAGVELSQEGEPVVVEVCVTAEGSKPDNAFPTSQGLDAAAADAVLIAEQQELIASLQAQVAELQQLLDVSQREKTSFYSRLQSARTVIAAARCSTPSSMLSSTSGLASPQPSFGALEPVFGSSICEEPEEGGMSDEDGCDDNHRSEGDDGTRLLPPPPPSTTTTAEEPDTNSPGLLCSSLSNWNLTHPEPTASPCRSPREPSTTPLCAEVSGGGGGGDAARGQHLLQEASEDLSQSMVWQQQYSQVRQCQQQYEHREQLAKAVHAAIAAGARLGYKPWESVETTTTTATPRQQLQQLQQNRSLAAVQEANPKDLVPSSSRSVDDTAAPATAGSGDDDSGSSSCDSETTRSNGSTRGSSVSCSALCETAADGYAAAEATEAATTEAQAHGWEQQGQEQQQQEQVAQDRAAAAAGVDATTAAAAAPPSVSESWAAAAAAASPGPVWGVADYEEEVRQLSDQLQGLIAQNSSYKALLQQRDAELRAQQERVEQQGHDLACCEDMLQELQERLAASEAAAAASAAEHCDAMWAKGQVAGLLELNELLQGQLEAQGQELEARAEEVEELRKAVEALQQEQQQHRASEQQQQGSEADQQASTAAGDDDAVAAAPPAAAADAAATVTCDVGTGVDAIPASIDVSTQTADTLLSGADANTTAAGAGGTVDSLALQGAVGPAHCQHTADEEGQQHLVEADSVTVVPADGCNMPTSSSGHSSGSKRAVSKRSLLLAAGDIASGSNSLSSSREGGTCALAAIAPHSRPPNVAPQHQQQQHVLSPFKQLRLQTHQLRVQPLNPQVASEQAALLRHELAAVGLHMQKQQLEQQLGEVKAQLQQLQVLQQRHCQQQHGLLVGPPPHGVAAAASTSPSSCLPEPWCTSPRAGGGYVGRSGSEEQEEFSSLGQQHPAQQPSSPLGRPQMLLAARWCGDQDVLAAAAGCGEAVLSGCPTAEDVAGEAACPSQLEQQDTTTASPPGSPAAVAGGSGEEEDEQQVTDTNSSSSCSGSASGSDSDSAASTPRSNSSSGDSSSGDSCAEMLAELLGDLHTLAAESHQASAFKAVSASTLSPLRRSQQQQQLQLRCSDAGGAGSRAVSGPALTGPSLETDDSMQAAAGAGPSSTCVSRGSSPNRAAQQEAAGAACRAAVDADAALKLQAHLQVSSAYELAATRGLLHAGAVVQELKCALAGSSTRHHQHRHTSSTRVSGALRHRQQRSSTSTLHDLKQREQQQPQQPQSPPLARTLFSQSFDVAALEQRESLDGIRAGSMAQLGQQQQQGFSILRQLQQQQQYIIQVLGSLSTSTAQQQQQQQQQLHAGLVNSGTTNLLPGQLQQLVDAQQQLQVLLHAASAVLQHQQLHSGPEDEQGLAAASLQGSGCWAESSGAAASAQVADAAGGSPSRQGSRKLLQLQGNSPDQQLQRDSSPDKLLRSSQRASHAATTTAAGAHGGSVGVLGAAQQPGVGADVQQQQEQELTQLRGRVIRLQLELQRAKQQQQQQQQAPHLAAADSFASSPDRSWAWHSQESGLSTPGGGATASPSGSSAVAGGGTAAAGFGSPGQVLLLSGRNRQLQSQCWQRECQIRHLEAEVRRLQLEANISKQQALSAAAAAACGGGGVGGGGGGVGSTGGGGGLLTPRNAALTPRHGLALAGSGHTLFSPQRRAVSSPGGAVVAATPRTHAAVGVGASSSLAPPVAGMQLSEQQQVHHHSHPLLPVPAMTRFASGSNTTHHSSGSSSQAAVEAAVAGFMGGSSSSLMMTAMRSSLDDGGGSCTGRGAAAATSSGGKPPLQPPHGKRA